MTLHEVTVFVQHWSPHVWLFGSLFGIPMSFALYRRARRAADLAPEAPVSDFWTRHAAWFLALHVSYAFVGVVAVSEWRSDWASLITILILVATPLILVYRSYDSLRLHRGDR